jgi:hypothetical protein
MTAGCVSLPQFATDDSGAEVLLGRTRVLTAVSAELVPPFADRGNEGRVQYNVEFSPMASPAFEASRPGPFRAFCQLQRPQPACSIAMKAMLRVSSLWRIKVDDVLQPGRRWWTTQ